MRPIKPATDLKVGVLLRRLEPTRSSRTPVTMTAAAEHRHQLPGNLLIMAYRIETDCPAFLYRRNKQDSPRFSSWQIATGQETYAWRALREPLFFADVLAKGRSRTAGGWCALAHLVLDEIHALVRLREASALESRVSIERSRRFTFWRRDAPRFHLEP
jgi:hypothetical protein